MSRISEKSAPGLNHPEKAGWTAFFAALFFLCSADVLFTTRIYGFNVRWGQGLLLLVALLAVQWLIKGPGKNSTSGRLHLQLLLHWVPFFILYGVAALASATPHLTAVKWAWGIFNIGLSALICLSARWGRSFERGFLYGIISLACLIWLEALLLYWFGAQPAANTGIGNGILAFPAFSASLPIGYYQLGFVFEGTPMWRPSAFYYEPSYAGCALAFAFPLVMAVTRKQRGVISFLIPAVVGSSVFLTSSRAGILSVFASMLFVLAWSWTRKQKTALFFTLKTAGTILLLVAAFSLPSSGRKYVRWIIGPFGSGSIQRLNNPEKTEGNRIENMKNALTAWNQHLYLGNGLGRQAGDDNRGLSQFSMNTWLEIGLESGLLGLLAFLFALLGNMRWALLNAGPFPAFVLAAWGVHLLIDYNFTQTYPRLDYWLLFFFSIRLLQNKEIPLFEK